MATTRPYVVLEQIDLWDLVRDLLPEELITNAESRAPGLLKGLEQALGGSIVYDEVTRLDARRADHAVKLALPHAWPHGGKGTLVPVPLKNWHPEEGEREATFNDRVGAR